MDRSAPQHSLRARRAASGRHDPACTSALGGAQAGAPVTADEIRDGLVLAFLARKRLLVLIGEAGSGRPALFRQLVGHVEADGAMALPVNATIGAEVEDLIAAAGSGALPDLAAGGDEDGEGGFDALVAALEERLDLAGAGLLAVDNATMLAPPVLADLVELTRAETPSGRFLQVLLCGSPELEGSLARAGLSDCLRDTGVLYRLAADAGAVTGEPLPELRPQPVPRPSAMLAAPAPAPDPEPVRPVDRRVSSEPANDWSGGGHDWSDQGVGQGFGQEGPGPDAGYAGGAMPAAGMRAPRRTGLYAGAALTTLVLLGAAGATIVTAMPGTSLDGAPGAALAAIGDGWNRARDAVERTVQDLIGGERAGAETPAAPATSAAIAPAPHLPATHAPSAELAPAVPGQGPLPQAQPQVQATAGAPSGPAASERTAPSPPAATQTVAKAPAGAVPAPAQPAPLQTAAVPPTLAPALQTPSPQTSSPLTPALQPPALPPAAAAPGANAEAAPGSASLPPLEEPSTATAIPAVPQAAAPDAETAQRVRVLVDQARRQLAGKKLTTPPGDNAYETVLRLRQLAPSAPETSELLTAMEETYRRWAMQAERDGDWAEARRFYERAQVVAPTSPDLPERIKAASEQRAYTGPAANPGAGFAPSPAVGGAKAAPGLQSREAVLALLRNPAELSRSLQSGTSPDTRLDGGKTLLMIAAEQGLTDSVRVLLDRHARTDLRTADGATAVMYAAWSGHDAVVKALADAGTDLDTTNSDGKTALMAAAARGHEDVARTLLQRGAVVDRTTAYGWSALMYAANNGHEGVAKLLLDRGANPYRMDTNGNSALTLGALQGHLQVVEALKPR
ncbi:ankyrin repeat domain-containing protein [Azospirillum picis]|uniref:ORC1/DEAH AAA+ ATPase domain-containing protein n=1 Tax=Azospirillum picis TaxID=488438 RepID=A0ABU0MQZ0_9PROT|nr:ankyrin repeat domain-containing protein [Azospirillum picis]MBP2302322.1 hypothetical protein [Azospirillum picis]MDQ0535901.1 hypothetical protein [Azospirillum picis]